MKDWLANLSALLAAAAAIAAGLYAVKALVFTARTPAGDAAFRSDPVRIGLEDDRRRAINHLREIQFDRDTGKLDQADYERLQTRYERQAVDVLARLDAYEKGQREGTL
jgi:hypothetical protein